MRKCIRRARVHIVRKLVRQVKSLRSKKGDEKHEEKNKRKADKLASELMILKKISEDNAARFLVTNEKSLTEILADPMSDAENRVLGRLASQKIIVDRVKEFKQKYPNYTEYLGPGKRKLMKLRRKAAKQAKKTAKLNTENVEGEETETRNAVDSDDDDDDENAFVESRLKEGKDLIEENVNIETGDKLEERVKPERQEKPANRNKRLKLDREKLKTDELSEICVTNKEATVKRFASLLEEEENKVEVSPNVENIVINEESEGDKIELEKEVDSFFVTENGDGEYMSVVVPKQNLPDEEEPDVKTPPAWHQRKSLNDSGRGRERGRGRGRGRETSYARNERYFDKIGDIERTNFGRGNKSRGGISRETKTRSDREKTVNDSVHPSWAAKKKQQDILKLGFQGKKIVFDDV